MDDLITELEEYAHLDRTEVGEYWAALVDMRKHSDSIGDAFSAALDIEIAEQVEYIRANFEIVEEEEQCSIVVRRLEYLG